MYKQNKLQKTSITVKPSEQGERIEQKVARITQQNEPIKDGAPIIYTERKDGVLPEYDIRTDRFEIAVEAMGKVHKMKTAERENRHKPKEEPKTGNEGEAGNEGGA